MSKQKTIGINPLEQYLAYATKNVNVNNVHNETNETKVQELQVVANVSVDGQSIAPAASLLDAASETDTALDRGAKQRITIHLSTDLINRVKNAVFWEPGLTLAALAEYALQQAIEKLEQERGAPYPQRREQNLRGGRPLK